MEDERIIDLYWQRSQEAISRTDEKYGRLCTKISLNILSNAQDAEECVSDTYMALWNSIPPQRPTCFQAFAAAIVRNLSLMKLREQYARKRGGGEFDLVLDELKDTIASGDSVEAECERKEFAAAVNQFLCTLSADDRNIFVCRYWFFASIADIALRFKCSQSKVKTSLFRTRQKLRLYLSMTSFDFLSGFNNIDPKFILDAIDLMQTVEASDAEKEIMNMENYTIHKKRTVRRSVLVAAVIALLCAMCVGAYAANLFGIRDAVMGRQIISDNYVDGEYAGKKLADGMTISMQGCIGSPEYEASREFNAFLSAYEANGYNGDALHQPLGDWGEAHGRVYNGLYTETLVNKFLEISEKYELTPWDELYEGSGYASFCEIIGSDGFLTLESPSRQGVPDYRVWNDGSFSYGDDWSTGGEEESFCTVAINRRVKGSMSIDCLSLDDAHEYHEWSYTTARGETVSVYSGSHQFIVLYNGENAFISLVSQPGDSLGDDEIKAYVESVDLSALDKIGHISLPA